MPGGRISSEADLIERFLRPLTNGHPAARELRDDVASLTPEPGHELVLTKDALVAGVHFFADDPAADIGWKALAVNVSDLAAKGATPLGYLMTFGFREAPEHDWMTAFCGGLRDGQDTWGMALLGGDTVRIPGPLTIDITAIGTVPGGQAPTRAGATAGDHIWVTGTLGDAALGLALRGGKADWPLDAQRRAHLERRYLRPQPRVLLGAAVREFATASMDLSDGLALDLGRLCLAGNVGAEVDLSTVPLSPAAAAVVAHEPGAWQHIVAGGDDYELLVCVADSQTDAFVAAANVAGVAVADIARVVAGEPVIRWQGGDGFHPASPGYDHFRATRDAT